MTFEFYVILPWLYYEVKANIKMPKFLGKNLYFYKNNFKYCYLRGKVFIKYILIFIYCWVLIFALSPFYILIYMF